MTESITLIVIGFLIGSIPTAYLAVRWVGGIDIRDYGSGNVGASNVIAHVSLWAGLVIGVFDCLVKGALPVLIGHYLDLNLWVQGVAGFAAIVGHNWSPFLKFTGGRGVATGVGVALGMMMWVEVLILGFIIFVIGRLLRRDTALWTFIAFVALPVFGYVMGRPPEVVGAAVVIPLLLLLKRLTANWEPLPPQHGFGKVLMYRLVWDRDVPKRVEWTERRPS